MSNLPIVEEGVRRDGDQELPLGPRAAKTRSAILVAATSTFAEHGYTNTTMGHVAAAAGVGLGTVYQYFRDRADLIRALVRTRVSVRLNQAELGWRAADGLDGVERMLGRFVSAYAETAAFAAVWEEVVHIEPELADLRRHLGRQFTDAVTHELRHAATQGLVRAGLDPEITARALTAMVDRFCFVTYVFDPPATGTPDPGVAAKELSLLWADAIGLRA